MHVKNSVDAHIRKATISTGALRMQEMHVAATPC